MPTAWAVQQETLSRGSCIGVAMRFMITDFELDALAPQPANSEKDTAKTTDLGRVLTEQNPVQAAASKDTAFTYDEDGNLLTATDANGHTTSYSYNARNEEVSVTDPMARTTSYG
jgi:YD repeat-containing protein